MPGVNAAAIGSPRLHLRSTDSTNSVAKRLADAGAIHGTTVTADLQTAGRGRQGRNWEAPAKSSLLISVICRTAALGSSGNSDTAALAPLAAGVAVAETCEQLDSTRAMIKWPNDVWLDRRKVSGILVEAKPEAGWFVVGIGLNAALTVEDLPAELQLTATTLGLDNAEAAFQPLVDRLDHWLNAPAADVLDAWRTRDVLIDQPVEWTGGSGTAAGVDDDGNLLVRQDGSATLKHIRSGEVHLGSALQ